MKLLDKFNKAWANKSQIAEGFWNEYVSNKEEIKVEKERRREICRKCEYYDAAGKGEIVVVKGQPACLLCGCNEALLTATMSAQCSATKIGLKARWEPILTAEQEREVNEIEYKEQFKNKQPE